MEETAIPLRETGGEDGSPNTKDTTSEESGTPTSHKRRSEGTSSSSPNMNHMGDEAGGEGHNGTGEEEPVAPSTERMDWDGEEEGTNLDDEFRRRLVEGRILPNPEATAALGEGNSVEEEHFSAGIQRQISSHMRWLRSNRAHWGSLQRSLIRKFQVAFNEGTLLIWMLQQALPYARGLVPPNHPAPSDPFPPLSPAEAPQHSQRMADKITHCDIYKNIAGKPWPTMPESEYTWHECSTAPSGEHELGERGRCPVQAELHLDGE